MKARELNSKLVKERAEDYSVLKIGLTTHPLTKDPTSKALRSTCLIKIDLGMVESIITQIKR